MRKGLNFVVVITLAIFLSFPIANTAIAEISPSTTKDPANASQRLTDVKLKTCQNKKAAIQKRNNQLTKTVENMLSKFDSIAARVKAFYDNKVLPAGKTVPNYDALIAEIAAKKAAVQTALDKATTSSNIFDCASDDPKGQLNQFRTDMQTVKQGLKDYRISIKNLIVTIRSVTGTTNNK